MLLVAALQDSGIVAETLATAAELTGDQPGVPVSMRWLPRAC